MGYKTPGAKNKTQKQHEAGHFPSSAQQGTRPGTPVVNGLSDSGRQLSSNGFSSQKNPKVSVPFVGLATLMNIPCPLLLKLQLVNWNKFALVLSMSCVNNRSNS